MYYFLSGKLAANSSGIEHAQIKRLKLFKQKGVPAKLAMREYNRFAHRNLPLYGLDDDDYVNPFDFFAGTVSFPAKVATVSDLPIPDDYQIKEINNGYEVYDGNRKTMRISLFSNGSIDTIDYFNADGSHTKQDFYDTRGFKSMTQIYDTADGHLIYEQLFRPNNTIFCEISYERKPKVYPATNIQLTDTHGKVHSLMNSGQAFTIMLDELNKQDCDEMSTFISDRSNRTNVPMINMKTPARKIEHFHSIHYRNYWDPSSPLSYSSISNNDLLSKTDIVITPSQRQADDMKKRLRTQVPVVAIPVGIVPDEQLNARHIPISERIPGKIVAIARLFPEKRLADAINAFAKAYKKNSTLSFDIYGYGNGGDGYKEEKMLKQLVKDLDLENVVEFKGYTQDTDSVYNSAELLLLTSTFEGFSLAILEAQSHGVPAISYNINYGPSDLVQNGKNGFLVPNGNVNDLAVKIEDYFANPELMKKLNEGAYESAKRFSSDNVWKYWEKYVISV